MREWTQVRFQLKLEARNRHSETCHKRNLDIKKPLLSGKVYILEDSHFNCLFEIATLWNGKRHSISRGCLHSIMILRAKMLFFYRVGGA